MYNCENEIRRTDLALRCAYPELETAIYKINPVEYVIHCMEFQGDFAKLSEEFNNEIRHIASPVKLSESAPVNFEKKLLPISFENPVDEFRASVDTETEVRGLVEAKFCDVEIVRIIHHTGMNYSIDITVGSDTTDEKIREMKKFLCPVLGADSICISKNDRESIDKRVEKEQVSEKHDPLLRMLEVRGLGYHKDLNCSAVEADYWFSNAEAIYENRITRAEIPFYRAEQKNCFMDCSLQSNFDIRKALFLYETVYIGMPLENHLDRFLQYQRMTKKELVELIDMGKVVLVLTNLESRYDKKLLNEAYSANPLGVIGRRGVNVLVASYLSELEKRYIQNYPEVYKMSRELYRQGRGAGDKKLLHMADVISFPLRAKAQSFRYLNTDGLFSLSAYGVNTLISSALDTKLDNEKKAWLDLCVLSGAEQIHLAMAINATYFPIQWQNGSNDYLNSDFQMVDIMDKLLSMYWYGKDQISFIQQARDIKGMELLELFECEKSLSVHDVANSADEWNTPLLFGRILDGIAKLPLEKQNEKIREYNHLLLEISKQPDRNSVTDMIMTGMSFVPMSDRASIATNVFDILQSMLSQRKPIKEYKDKRNLKWKMEKTEKRKFDQQSVDEIYLLDKIYRVARLQQRNITE